MNTGWNWISFNLDFPDSTINSALNPLLDPAGDLIKGQTTFSTNINNTWTGSLEVLTNTSLYLYNAVKPNTIKLVGNPITPATFPIPVVANWNWISYIPTYKLTVNAALASLTPTVGDIIKNQTSFAQYTASGWIGDLKKLEPDHGYMLRLTNPGTITYPPQSFTDDEQPFERNAEPLSTFWNVDASQYEHNMTFIGIFEYDETNATTAEMELGAFTGGEIRGVAEAIYVEYLDAYMFFMTCFANKSGEQLQFRLFDGATGEIQTLAEKLVFSPHYHQGTITDPLPFHLQTTSLGEIESELSFNVQPNPFRDETMCQIQLPNAQEVQLIITDVDGKHVYFTEIQASAGMNSFIWKGCSTSGTPLDKGIYFIRLQTEQGILTKKVVLQR